MKETSKDIQLQYIGFLKTPLLWKDDSVLGLTQLKITTEKTPQYNSVSKPEIRLGKRVEQFSYFTFQQEKTTHFLAKNIQIQDGKRTVGELDCLLLKNNQPIHIEIVYKFYLYDKSVGNTEIEHWIGPNRRDSFFQKLIKLKNKQLPLLHNNHSKKYLKNLQLKTNKIDQKVFFKAQLFVPLKDLNKTFLHINNNCIIGFYISFPELEQFENCKFFIPTKVNWLIEIQKNTNWLNFKDFKTQLQVFLTQKIAPLCWIKFSNGITQKLFVVWW